MESEPNKRTLRIVVAERYEANALTKLRAIGDVVELYSPDPKALRNEVGAADALLVRSYTQVTASILDAAPRLKVIARGGVGLDNIDLESAARRRIAVVYTPEASTQAVAEFTVGLILALERKIAGPPDRVTLEGFLSARNEPPGREFRGLTLGIVGLGRIGKTVARIAGHGLGMKIIYHDIVRMGLLDFVAEAVESAELLARSDVLSLHVPLTTETRNWCGESRLRQMKSTCTLINTARGGIVDSIALAGALAQGRIAGAALDVHQPEPIPEDHPIRTSPHVLLTPHIAARTVESIQKMNDVVDDVIKVLQGKPPRYAYSSRARSQWSTTGQSEAW